MTNERMTNVEKKMIAEAVRVLKRGGVIAYPTETTYGLGCDPRNAKAIARIYRLKGREKKHPLLLVAASEAQVRSVVGAIHELPLRVARRHWPGPLTLVLPIVGTRHAVSLPKPIAPKGGVAIRVSSSLIVQALCRAHGFPIVSTSANRSGEPECRSGRAVRRVFTRRGGFQTRPSDVPDFILDVGSLPRRKPSTVARIKKDGRIEVLRQGTIRI